MADTSKDTESPVEPSAGSDAGSPEAGRRRADDEKAGSAGDRVKAGADAARNKLASLVWLVAVVCALFLAVGALLIALNANRENEVVMFVLDGARLLEGPFDDLFRFQGENAETKDALVNWGIAAVVFLVVGKILDRVIRP